MKSFFEKNFSKMHLLSLKREGRRDAERERERGLAWPFKFLDHVITFLPVHCEGR